MTQQETLNDFINRRMAELGIGYKALTNAGIGAQTMVNIRKGKVTGLQLVTRQKLAEALRCSMGDIQAAIANTVQVTPFGEEVQKVPVKKEAGSTMKAVEKLADTLQEQGLLSEENQQKAEESESVPDKTDTKPDKSESILDKTDTKTDECESVPRLPEMPKQPKLKRKKIVPKGLTEAEPAAETTNTQTVEEYRQQLKDMCLKEFARFGRAGTMEAAYVAIARELLKDLLGEGVAE